MTANKFKLEVYEIMLNVSEKKTSPEQGLLRLIDYLSTEDDVESGITASQLIKTSYTDPNDFMDVPPGLYFVNWITGGTDIAAIGLNTGDGKWFAPVNCLSSPAHLSEYIGSIGMLHKIGIDMNDKDDTRFHMANEPKIGEMDYVEQEMAEDLDQG